MARPYKAGVLYGIAIYKNKKYKGENIMFKRKVLIAAVLCGTMLLTACSGGGESGLFNDTSTSMSSSEESSSTTEESTSTVSEPEPDPEPWPPEITENGAVAFYCVEDREMIYSENAESTIALASITKLLTASVALQNLPPDTVITVGSELDLVKPNSSLCYIAKGQKLTLRDLITGMMLPSGNDAAYTVAVAVARASYPNETLSDEEAVEIFADMMNSFAKRIGMRNSHFANPEGWDDELHFTTVSDLILLAQFALTIPEIREDVSTLQKRVVYKSGEVATWYNSNYLLSPSSKYYSEHAIGLKTGSTGQAGYCLLSAFEKNGKTYICAVMGCESNDERYVRTWELLEKYT